jgi:Bacterial archaeo-eukaryotic release factor family 3
MDVIRRTDLERLALQGRGPCVSVFLPTHRAGPEAQQGPIRLKNLLRQAIKALQADGVKAPMIHSVLAPLWRLVDDGLFWQYQSDGLALYSRPGWWRALRVPLDLPELAVVANRFHIGPLLPLLTSDGHFFVLALSQNRIRLLEGTCDRLEEVDLPGVPPGIRDALQGQEAQKPLQLYVADRGGVAARGIFHGHGSASDVQKERVLRYFRKVNRALREVLAGERAPMVLAAVEHLAPVWRQVNAYPHLVDQVLAGSPEELGPHELHARVWAVAEPLFLQGQRAAAAKYHQLAGTGRTSRDPREIIRAAKEGRVETLFAARQPTGVGSANGGPSRNGDRALRDVLELAAVATLLKGAPCTRRLRVRCRGPGAPRRSSGTRRVFRRS